MAQGNEYNDWHGLLQGDENSFMRLYDKHYQPMFSFGLTVCHDKDVVKDAIHEVFCELWDNRSRFPVVQNEKAYLMTYLKRKILREIEKQQRNSPFDDSPTAFFEKSYEELLIERQSDDANREQLKSSLEQLTAGQLEIIQLKYFEMLDYEQIAEKLQLQPRTVYNQVSKAMKTLRSALKVLSSVIIAII
jgi:RNA polymerase sigma factor (sigma-70 family)